MYCKNCGKELAVKSNFCNNCGYKYENYPSDDFIISSSKKSIVVKIFKLIGVIILLFILLNVYTYILLKVLDYDRASVMLIVN